MLHPQGGVHKVSFDMSKHHPSPTQPLSIGSYQSCLPQPTLPVHETSLVTGLTQSESKQQGRVVIWQMPHTHRPKAVAVCGPSWQESQKLSLLNVLLRSVHEVCSQRFALTCKKKLWVSNGIIWGELHPDWYQ